GSTSWTVTNQGILQGNARGVCLDGAGSVLTNSGTISGNTNSGVNLGHGGTINNQTNGIISGTADVVRVDGAAGIVTNAGTITASTGTAVFLVQSGNITNQQTGKISGFDFGILMSGSPQGTIINAGSITATDRAGIGVRIIGPIGTLTNQSGGTISGGTNGVGVDLSACCNATVTNEQGGTISGANAILVDGTVTNAGTITGVTKGVSLLTDASS